MCMPTCSGTLPVTVARSSLSPNLSRPMPLLKVPSSISQVLKINLPKLPSWGHTVPAWIPCPVEVVMETAKLSILFFMIPGAQGLCLQQAVSVSGARGSTVSSFKEFAKTHLTRCVLCPARPSFPSPSCEAVLLTCHLTAPPPAQHALHVCKLGVAALFLPFPSACAHVAQPTSCVLGAGRHSPMWFPALLPSPRPFPDTGVISFRFFLLAFPEH